MPPYLFAAFYRILIKGQERQKETTMSKKLWEEMVADESYQSVGDWHADKDLGRCY